MSILNDVVSINLDRNGYEEPSTPLRDPASSPAAHIQWQNSQSACAAIEELRAAASVPPRPPKPLTFDFELAPSAGSSSPSDPFFPPRTRVRSVRSRALERVKSRSQNDVLAIPATDVSNFLNMLGRASARVDENSRKRMKMRENSVANTEGPDGGYSSLPIMQPKNPSSQNAATTTHADADDVHMNVDVDTFAHAGDDDAKLLPSTHPKNGIKHVPPRSPATTRRSQKRAAPPSPTPVRSSAPPATLRPMSTHRKESPRFPQANAASTTTWLSLSGHLLLTEPHPSSNDSVASLTASASAARAISTGTACRRRRATSHLFVLFVLRPSLFLAAQTSFRHDGTHRLIIIIFLLSTFSNSAAKKPFRPPLAAARFSPSPMPPVNASRASSKDEKSFGTDPDSSFDLAFDFDPDELEAAMKNMIEQF
ncbi:hypothetical protein BGW80DRAFT_1460618 [Lactifluus volemus]|nr:hypothetical protein BGW80DRAFT_1460618 [Lactifluus volemus]